MYLNERVCRRARCRWVSGFITAALLLLLIGAGGANAADRLCVNPRGTQGCFSTIQEAIDSVSATGTTIEVAPGTYTASCNGPACSVAAIVGPSLDGLTLQCGNGRGRSVTLDASSLDHAVYVSGADGVTIAGCVAENAEREGILVENSDNVHVADNDVVHNDRAMAKTVGQGGPPCPTFIAPHTPGTGAIQCCPDAYPGGAGNFPSDNDDCGEGIHLRSVTNSVVEDNLVHNNIGGILLTDETGPNHNNLVVDNTSRDNTAFGGDCGVTLPSHPECAPGSTDVTGCGFVPPVNGYGVYNNEVIGNVLLRNGAAGAGMFANPGAPPGAATKSYGNVISDNVIEDNGEPGVAIHVHAANGNADNNVITDNVIRGNGGDTEAEPSGSNNMGIEVLSNGSFGNGFGGAAPIKGTIISGNKISGEDYDVWVGNTGTDAQVSVNNLIGNGSIGVKNGGSGTVTATDNYWGCPQGPNKGNCSGTSGTVVSSPFSSHPVNPQR